MSQTSTFLELYFQDLYKKLKIITPELTTTDFTSIRNDIITKFEENKSSITDCEIYNNHKDTLVTIERTKLLDLIYDKKPNISGFGTLFNHRENVPAKVIKYFTSHRKIAKQKMFEHVNDIDPIIHDNYDLLQKVLKVLANSYYGVFGQSSFQFFNPLLGPSVTQTGQFITISAILAFEGFMTGNYQFNDLDELITYINNILQREINFSPNKLIAFKKIRKSDVEEVILSKIKFELSDDDHTIIDALLSNLNDKQLELVFFRNNLYDFLNKTYYNADEDFKMSDLLYGCYSDSFLDPNHAPDEIKEYVDELWNCINDYVVYDYQYNLKVNRVESMLRKCIIISDTDSTFLNMEPTVSWFKDKFELDSMSDEEQIFVVNIFVYLITQLVKQVFAILTKQMNFAEDKRPLIKMKSEFNYSRIILTKNKKQYAGKILLQEGKLLSKPKYDVKGLSIKKIGTPKIARDAYERILNQDILDSAELKPLEVFKKINHIEQQIESSLMSGNTEYTKPSRFSSESKYKLPMSQQVVKAVRLWNFLFGDISTIPNSSSVNIAKLKSLSCEEAKALLPEELHGKLDKYFNSHELLKDKPIEAIAIPKNFDKLPKEIIPLLNADVVINDIIKPSNILLESLGFTVLKSNKFEVVSNITNI